MTTKAIREVMDKAAPKLCAGLSEYTPERCKRCFYLVNAPRCPIPAAYIELSNIEGEWK